MDRGKQPNSKPPSLQQSWWVGTAKRPHILRNFIIICIVIALLILGLVIAINP
jgi:hypothetical protein